MSDVIEKKNKHCKKIQTNHLLALCEIGEDYKFFCDDLEQLIKSKGNRNLVSKVYNVLKGNLFIDSSKYKEFIEKHRNTIEIMNKYSCLMNLTDLSYDKKGQRRENLPEDYFYRYIQEHKEDIETIKAVASKIKDLEINEITLGEKLDFTEIEYEFNDTLSTSFAFLENMEVNPTYFITPIKYKTNGSCYRMILEIDGYGNNQEISKYGRNIELNSLIFDPNRLPNEITPESTIGIIRELAEQKKTEYEDIRNSVDLSDTTNDLTSYFETLKKVAEKIDKTKDNQELANILNQMQNSLTQLQLFGVNYENQIIDSHTGITKETMNREKKEKKLVLERRYFSEK